MRAIFASSVSSSGVQPSSASTVKGACSPVSSPLLIALSSRSRSSMAVRNGMTCRSRVRVRNGPCSTAVSLSGFQKVGVGRGCVGDSVVALADLPVPHPPVGVVGLVRVVHQGPIRFRVERDLHPERESLEAGREASNLDHRDVVRGRPKIEATSLPLETGRVQRRPQIVSEELVDRPHQRSLAVLRPSPARPSAGARGRRQMSAFW
jgi:hypothetical protein